MSPLRRRTPMLCARSAAICAAIVLAAAAAGVRAAAPTVWPNSISSANSDQWLIRNHDRIKVLKPRVLVLNFSNNRTPEQAKAIVDKLIAAVAESSRYHGYAN